MKRGWARAYIAAGLTLLSGALGASTASAASADPDVNDGVWYYTFYRTKETHEAGIDGSGVTIAVIENGINAAVSSLAGANIAVQEPALCRGSAGEELPANTTDFSVAAHGTGVTGMIAGTGEGAGGYDGMRGVAPGARVLVYGTGRASGSPCFDQTGAETSLSAQIARAVDDAVAQGAAIVSLSLVGGESEELLRAITAAQQAGVIIVAAEQNADDAAAGTGDMWPTAYNGVLGVRAIDANGEVPTTLDGAGMLISQWADIAAPGVSIYVQGAIAGEDWNVGAIADGSSYATPITAATLALAMQQYPEATSNQILQSLIRNTGVDAPHEPVFDAGGAYGYGPLDLISLLADNPAQYADVNPLLVDLEGADPSRYGPTIAQVTGEAEPVASPPASESPRATPSTTPTAAAVEDSGGLSIGLIFALAGAAVVLVAVVIVVVVVSSRNRGRGRG